MSQRIDLPFFAGQDESFDEKVLPAGAVHSAVNVRMDRTGRMKRRYATFEKSNLNEKGVQAVGAFLDFADPDYTQRGYINFRKTAHQYTRDANSEIVRELDGELPAFTTIRHFYTAGRPDVGGQQFCPQAVYDTNGNLVIACLLGELGAATYYVLEVLDPITLEVIHRKEERLNTDNPGPVDLTARNMRLVRDDSRAAVYVVFDSPTGSPGVYFHHVETTGSFDIIFKSAVVVATGVTQSDTIDAVHVPDGSGNWMLASANLYVVDSTGNILGTYIHDTLPGTPRMHSVDASSDRFYWATGGNSQLALLSMKYDSSDSKGYLENLTGDTLSVGIAKARPTGNYTTAWVSWTRYAVPRTKVYYWSVGYDSMEVRHDDLHNDVPVCAPYETGENVSLGRATTAHFASELFLQQDLTDTQLANRQFNTEGPIHVWSSNLVTDGKLWGGKGGGQARDIDRAGTGWIVKDYLLMETGTAHPAELQDFSPNRPDLRQVVFPLQIQNAGSSWENDTEGTGSQVTSVWAIAVTDTKRGRQHLQGETLVPGGSLHMLDGHAVYMAGYAGPPNMRDIQEDVGTGNMLAGEYWFSVLFEHSDANGRVWKSAPAVPRQLTLNADAAANVIVSAPVGLAAQSRGARAVLYVSPPGGTILYRQIVEGISPGQEITIRIDDEPLNSTETLYTLGDTVPNDPPPQAQFTARSGNRIWAAGLADSARIQASKILKPGVGVEWSEFDNYFVDLPAVVVGIAPMDSFLIVMTAETLYAVSGTGPDDQAIGGFPEAQRMPGSVGCASGRSIISHELGIFFQSQRGIELLPRGFQASDWVGQAVMDVHEDFPYCAGACFIPTDNTVRWLYTENVDHTGAARVIIFDVRAKCWTVNDYDDTLSETYAWIMSRNLGDFENPTQYHMVLGGIGSLVTVHQDDFDNEYQGDPRCVIETGSLRTAGLNGWNYGRRVNITGEYRGPTDVTLEFAFNDSKYLPQDTFTWQLTDTDYSVGDPIELELTLPVQLYSTVKFKLSWTNVGANSFHANGLSVFFEPATEGPRVPARAKG